MDEEKEKKVSIVLQPLLKFSPYPYHCRYSFNNTHSKEADHQNACVFVPNSNKSFIKSITKMFE